MTGHGEAFHQKNEQAIAVEVRTVNNRYFKLTVRSSEVCNALESQIESTVRRHIRRGTVQVNLRIDRQSTDDDYQLNEGVLASYRRQLEKINKQLQSTETIHLESLLALPGVVDERSSRQTSAEADWPVVETALVEALQNLSNMRSDEGRAMGEDLQENRRQIASELTAIHERAPLVVEAYSSRLTERLNKLLADYDVKNVEPADVVREVGLFGERSDISEEIVRLRSHLEQFDEIMELPESSGRKLEFLIQEMFREVNTIGSKANDAPIARHVIEIKAAIERMREMIQNVE